MRRIRALLVLLVIAELGGAAWYIASRESRPILPTPNFSRLPRSTSADLERLQAATQTERPHAWRELGEAFLAYGYFVEAEVCLRYAAMQDSADVAAIYGWACSLDRMGRTREAQQHFETVAQLANPGMRRSALYQLARNYLRNEDAVAAERAFALLDNFPPADLQRARLLISMDREEEATFLSSRLQKAYPNDLHVQLLGLRIARFTSNGAAAEHVDRAERSFPQFALTDQLDYLHSIRSRYGLHAMLARVEAANDAKQLTDAAVQFENLVRDTDVEFLLDKLAVGADLELRSGRPQEAKRLLQMLADRIALPPTALHLLGGAWLGLGETQQARETWERANRLRPRAESHSRLADLLEQEGDADGAKQERGLAQLETGIQAYRQNQLAAALERLEQAAQAVPHEARMWFYLGEVRRVLSQREAAIEAYQQCVKLNPNHGRALARLE